jgi:pSer/pThr/pTyr-binding forkhead associated (FHA) protein
MISLKLRKPGGTERPLPVPPGHHSVGGGPNDRLRLEGAPPTLFDLEVSLETVIAVSRTAGVSLASRKLKVGERWLLRAGQSLCAGGFELSLQGVLPVPAVDATAALARCMLGNGAAPGSAVPTLVWLNGRDCGRRMPLLDEATFLGRGDGAAARVRDALASRTHAKIAIKDGHARLTHLASANGLLVDGVTVESCCDLYGDEVIRIGETEILFEARLTRPPAPVSAPAAMAVASKVEGALQTSARRRRRAVELAVISIASAAGAFMTAAAWLWAR